LGCAIAVVLLASCAQLTRPEAARGRWISYDSAAQRFSVDAAEVPRGALLDELQAVSGVDVRAGPAREQPVTAQARDLDLDALLRLLLPADARVAVWTGERDVAVAPPDATRPKRGPAQEPLAGAVPKPEPAAQAPVTKPTGALKLAADDKYEPREVTGPGAKRPVAELLRVASTEPKQPVAPRAPSETIRIQLQFEDGAPPRVIDVRAIEGRAPTQRFVAGNFLFVVLGSNGDVLQAGTFQDPLVEHSYLPEGPHSTGRARTGTAGISIRRESLAGGALRVIDLTGVALPRELDERTVRVAMERGKPILQLEAAAITRLLQQEPRK
jgi:hypothetical protein